MHFKQKSYGYFNTHKYVLRKKVKYQVQKKIMPSAKK